MEAPSPPPSPRKPFPGIAQTLGLFLIAAVLGLGAVMLYFLAVAMLKGVDAVGPSAWVIVVGNTAGLLGASWIGLRISGSGPGDAFPWRAFDVRLIFPLFALVGGTLLALGAFEQFVFENWIQGTSRQTWLEDRIQEIMELLLADRLSAFLAVVVVAPLTEEVFFRGLILNGFKQRYSEKKAVWAQAALFSLMHMNPVQMPFTLVLGALFGWLRLRTGSLWPPVLCHVLNNGSVLLLTWGLGEDAEVPGWGFLPGAALAFLSFLAIRRTVKESPPV